MRVLVPIAFILGTAACGGTPERRPEPVAPDHPVAVDPPAPSGPCLALDPGEPRVVAHATDRDVRFCVLHMAAADAGSDALAKECWTIDLASGALREGGVVPALDESAPPFVARAEPAQAAIVLCPNGGLQADQCETHKPKLAKGETLVAAAVNDANTRLAYVVAAAGGDARVVIAPLVHSRLQKPSASFAFGDASARCGTPAWLGAFVYVRAASCVDGAEAYGELFDEKGKKLSDVGGPPAADGQRFRVDAQTPLATDAASAPSQWAFLDAAGGRIALHDVATGALVRVVDLAVGSGAAPGASGWSRTPDGRLVVVSGPPDLGAVFVVDPANGQVRRVAGGRACPRSAP